MRKYFYTLFLYIHIHVQLVGQFYPLGLNPRGLHWQQINTDKVQVIYPEEVDEQAQRVANLVHFLSDSSFYSLGQQHKKVSIVLQNQTTISNGFVTVSPFRSEFYLTPPQYNFNGVGNWLDMLGIHEYRHVEQFSNARRGITKYSSWLFGQNGWGAATGLALPRWFMEGDAVFYETALTNSGRGRMPDFANDYKAVLLAGHRYSYEKASSGSYKHFVPNHYTLGYFMTTQLRRNFGEDIWTDIMGKATSYRYPVYPLSMTMKKRTGLRTPQLYRQTMSELTNMWMNEEQAIDFSQSVQISPAIKKTYTSYTNPVFLDNETLVATKSGFRTIPTYVSIQLKDTTEKRLIQPGIFYPSNARLSARQNTMVWSELQFDNRWANRDYLVVMKYDLSTGKKTQITKKSRLFSPSLSPSGQWIAAVSSPDNGNHQVIILSAETGEEVNHIPQRTDGESFAFPTWRDEETLIVVLKKNNQNALAKINLADQSVELASPYWAYQIGYPYSINNRIFFTGNFTGNEEIFEYDPIAKTIQKHTTTHFGARQPVVSPDGKTLVYSEFTATGYQLRSLDLDGRH
ncbi:MAG: hypothetical protein OEY56_07510, partial [Cyclobacteriaceae bacterium]|nr:hypothetical protein [Cyclobacteriaceae bacterium]